MKNYFLIVCFCFILSKCFAEKYPVVFFDSNINYAPLGFKILLHNDSSKVCAYFTAKLSEDVFTRKINQGSEPQEIYSFDTFDVNETVFAGGVNWNLSKNTSFYTGLGVMGGRSYILEKYGWIRSTSISVMPLISFGILLRKKNLWFSLGNETAFASSKNYPVLYLNDNSFARLSSFTLGIGYVFEL